MQWTIHCLAISKKSIYSDSFRAMNDVNGSFRRNLLTTLIIIDSKGIVLDDVENRIYI